MSNHPTYRVKDLVFVRKDEGIFDLSNKKCEILSEHADGYVNIRVDGKDFKILKKDIIEE